MQRNCKFDSVFIGSGSLLGTNFGKLAIENRCSNRYQTYFHIICNISIGRGANEQFQSEEVNYYEFVVGASYRNQFSNGIALFVQTITKSSEELNTEIPIGIRSGLLSKVKGSKPSVDNVA